MHPFGENPIERGAQSPGKSVVGCSLDVGTARQARFGSATGRRAARCSGSGGPRGGLRGTFAHINRRVDQDLGHLLVR